MKNDKHCRSFSGEWKLSPAYDITFSYDLKNRWLSAHQMLINGKKDRIKLDDIITCGKNMDTPVEKVNKQERVFGLLKGKIWMADDFDETPPGFEDYM